MAASATFLAGVQCWRPEAAAAAAAPACWLGDVLDDLRPDPPRSPLSREVVHATSCIDLEATQQSQRDQATPTWRARSLQIRPLPHPEHPDQPSVRQQCRPRRPQCSGLSAAAACRQQMGRPWIPGQPLRRQGAPHRRRPQLRRDRRRGRCWAQVAYQVVATLFWAAEANRAVAR